MSRNTIILKMGALKADFEETPVPYNLHPFVKAFFGMFDILLEEWEENEDE